MSGTSGIVYDSRFNTDSSANKLRHTYVKGYVDISGGDLNLQNGAFTMYNGLSSSAYFSIQNDGKIWVTYDGELTSISLENLKILKLAEPGGPTLGDVQMWTRGIRYYPSETNDTLIGLGGLTVTGTRFKSNTYALFMSDVSINGRLNVDNDVSFNSRLFVGSDVSFNSKLMVMSDVSFNSRLFVNNDVSFNSKLFVNNDVSFNSRLFVNNDVSFNSKLFVNNDVSLNSRLFVNNDVSFNSKLFVNNDVSLNSRLFVNNDVSFNSKLMVRQDVSLNSRLFVNNDVSFNSKLFVNNDVSLNSRLFVNNDVSFNSKLFVNNDVSLNSRLFVNNDVSFNSKLMVNNDVSFNSNLFVGRDVSFNSKLFVKGDVSLNSNLTVVGNVKIENTLTFKKQSFANDETITPTYSLVEINSGTSNIYSLADGYFDGQTIRILSNVVDSNNSLNVNGKIRFNTSSSFCVPVIFKNSCQSFDAVWTNGAWIVAAWNGVNFTNSNIMFGTAQSGDIEIGAAGKLYVNSPATIVNNATLSANLFVTADTSLNSRLYVASDTLLNGNVSVNGDLRSDKNIYARKSLMIGQFTETHETTPFYSYIFPFEKNTINYGTDDQLTFTSTYTSAPFTNFTYDSICKIGNYSGRFTNGTTAKFFSSNIPFTNVSSGFSISFWFKSDNITYNSRIIQFYNLASDKIDVFFNTVNSSNYIAVQLNGSGVPVSHENVKILADTWYHVGITISSTNVIIYVNGIAFPITGNGTVSALTSSAKKMYIGSNADNTTGLSGLNIDQLIFGFSVLSANDIMLIFKNKFELNVHNNLKLLTNLTAGYGSYTNLDFNNATFNMGGIICTDLTPLTNNSGIYYAGIYASSMSFMLNYDNAVIEPMKITSTASSGTNLANIQMNGNLSVAGNTSFTFLPTCSGTPTSNTQLATKAYVDSTVTASTSGSNTLTGLVVNGSTSDLNATVSISKNVGTAANFSAWQHKAQLQVQELNGNALVLAMSTDGVGIIQGKKLNDGNYKNISINPLGGSVGIGKTSITSGYELDVNGDVQATSYNAVSDYRIKENIMILDASFNVDVLKPVTYNLKESGKQDIGFIAHEVQEFYPFLVSGVKDGPTTQSLNYNGLIGILTKEIKDLKKEMRIVREANTKLDSDVSVLHLKLEAESKANAKLNSDVSVLREANAKLNEDFSKLASEMSVLRDIVQELMPL